MGAGGSKTLTEGTNTGMPARSANNRNRNKAANTGAAPATPYMGGGRRRSARKSRKTRKTRRSRK
jgi:hypothetical protein